MRSRRSRNGERLLLSNPRLRGARGLSGPRYTSGVIRFLAISGSLRAGSSNAALLDAARRLRPQDVAFDVYDGLAAIPAFSPDADIEPAPDAVTHWRSALARADAILVSSPEYAHGVPGALKNALDWVVGSGELMAKPIALLNPSPASLFAHPQLAEILTTMDARVVPDASVTIPIPRRGADGAMLAADANVAGQLRVALGALLAAVRQASPPGR